MCGYCKGAFEAYTRVLKVMGDKIQLVIRLGVNLDDQNAEPTQIAFKLMEIYHDQGANSFTDAYSDWFADRTYSKWVKKYGVPKNNPMHAEVFFKQSEWSKNNNIQYTPASVINGAPYPKKYTYDELFYFVGMMLENQTEEVSGEERSIEV